MKRTAIPKRRSKPRRGPLRDAAYLHWLTRTPCCICVRGVVDLLEKTEFSDYRRSDPAHGPVNGMGSKGADNEATPLCRHHHDELDGHAKLPNGQVGRKAFERFYDVDLKAIAARCWAAYQARRGAVAVSS